MVASFAATKAQDTTAQFSGLWQLKGTGAGEDAPYALLITAVDSSMLILLERRYDAGTRFENYTTDPARFDRFFRATSGGGQLTLTRLGNGGTGAAPETPDHDEVLSIADGMLHLTLTDRWRDRPARVAHLVYGRVPLPAHVEPGANLVDNGDVGRGDRGWRAFGDAKIEAFDGNPCFVVRNRGSFGQTVLLPSDAEGKFIVMVASASSERVHADQTITGLPSLYATVAISDGSRFVDYFQGMLGRSRLPNAWTKVVGIFQVKQGAARVYVQLNQAEGNGVPQNGSAARFDDVGVFLFPNESTARSFADEWRGRGTGLERR